MATQPQNAFDQFFRQKPPAKMDGFLKLVAEGPAEFTKEEQHRIGSSEARSIFQALQQCQGLRAQLRSKRQQAEKYASKELHQQAIVAATHRYTDCLAFYSCPVAWKLYSTCWAHLPRTPTAQLQQLYQASNGNKEVFCQEERQHLERCIGRLVSGAVAAASFPAGRVTNKDIHETELYR